MHSMDDFQRQVADLSSQVGVIPVVSHPVTEERKSTSPSAPTSIPKTSPGGKPATPSNPQKTVPFKKPSSSPSSSPTPAAAKGQGQGSGVKERDWKEKIGSGFGLFKGSKKGLTLPEFEDFVLRGFGIGAIILRCAVMPGYPLHFLLPVIDRILNPVPIVLILLVMGYLGFRFKRMIWLERSFALGVIYSALAFLFPVIL